VIAAIHDACGSAIPNVYQGDITDSEAGDLLYARSIGADGAQVNNPDVVADALDEPVTTRLETSSGEVCLLSATHGFGFPEKQLTFKRGGVTTGRGGCATLPSTFKKGTIAFTGDGSALPSSLSVK
jgi:hypothetical protein